MRLFADTPSRGLPPSSTAAPAAAASAPTHATGTSGTGRRGRLGSFGSVVHKERVEVEAVGQYPRPDGIAADREGAVRDWVLPPHGNLGLAQVGVHCGIDPDDGPVDDSAVLELDGHGLPVQLLQKLDQLHGVFPFELERASRTEFLGGLRSYYVVPLSELSPPLKSASNLSKCRSQQKRSALSNLTVRMYLHNQNITFVNYPFCSRDVRSY